MWLDSDARPGAETAWTIAAGQRTGQQARSLGHGPDGPWVRRVIGRRTLGPLGAKLLLQGPLGAKLLLQELAGDRHEVPLGDHTDQATVLDDGEAADPVLTHQLESVQG